MAGKAELQCIITTSGHVIPSTIEAKGELMYSSVWIWNNSAQASTPRVYSVESWMQIIFLDYFYKDKRLLDSMYRAYRTIYRLQSVPNNYTEHAKQ